MILSLVVIEGQNVSVDTLRSLSLGNAKQLVVGDAYGFGVILHIAAEAPVDLRSRHRTNYAQVSSGCFDFQDHNHQLKNNFMKNLSKLFYHSYLAMPSANLHKFQALPE